MKSAIFFFTIIFSFSHWTYCQEIKVSKVTSDEINKFAESIRNVEQFKSDSIFVKCIESGFITTDTIPGLEDQDVVLYRLLIIVKEITQNDQLKSNIFWVDGNFYNPRNYQFSRKIKLLSITTGLEENPKIVNLKVSVEEIKKCN